jgi:large subunit ribosomal protein L19
MNELLAATTDASLRSEPLAPFNVGDTIEVHTRIKEGDKERTQIFTGTVLRKVGGHGDINDSFTVRRIVDGEGIERVFPVHSPKVLKIKVTRQGKVRRAKLYYLRDRVGKATKVKEKVRRG